MLKLAVGKSYLNRKGQKILIVKKLDNYLYPYQSEDRDIYQEDGRWLMYNETNMDLVEEVEAEGPSFLVKQKADLALTAAMKAASRGVDPLRKAELLDDGEATTLWNKVVDLIRDELCLRYKEENKDD